ncbi:neutral zinc metallopeptidase [Corynebacterium suedekumii]|nr:neutral zinc metallopeptidase [Corynebacterium suedekumii]
MSPRFPRAAHTINDANEYRTAASRRPRSPSTGCGRRCFPSRPASSTEPLLVVFQDTTRSGCGMASAETGPFYCPADQGAYFDVSRFFEQLEQLGGTNAPLAQMYIVAHRVRPPHPAARGAPVPEQLQRSRRGLQRAVQVELQADCYAGIWISQADKGDDALLAQADHRGAGCWRHRHRPRRRRRQHPADAPAARSARTCGPVPRAAPERPAHRLP